MTNTTQPYFTSKSGKKLSIQHGSCWYEEHDTNQFNIFKVLVDSIQKGQPGYVRHENAVRTLKRFMTTARFGTATQIEYLLTVNRGAKQEHVTYILNKYQFLVMAAALSDEYLQLAVSSQHANLSAEELAMDSFEFMRMIKKQADTLMDESTRNETSTQTNARIDALVELDNLITEFEVNKANFVDTTDPAHILATADQQLTLLQAESDNDSAPSGIRNSKADVIKAAVTVRDTVKQLLIDGVSVTLESAKSTISTVTDLVDRANDALSFINAISVEYRNAMDPKDLEIIGASNNQSFLVSAYTFHLWTERQQKIMKWLRTQKIDGKDTKRIQECRDDLIEFGLYAVLYDRSAMTVQYNALAKAYKAKYGYTDKQMDYIFTVFNTHLMLPEFAAGLFIIQCTGNYQWKIFHVTK